MITTVKEILENLSAYCVDHSLTPKKIKLTYDVTHSSTKIDSQLIGSDAQTYNDNWVEQIDYTLEKMLERQLVAFSGPFFTKFSVEAELDMFGIKLNTLLMTARFNVDQPRFRIESFRVVLNELRKVELAESSNLFDGLASSFTLEFKGSKLRFLDINFKYDQGTIQAFTNPYFEQLETVIGGLTGSAGAGYPATKLTFDLSKRNSLQFLSGSVVPKQTFSYRNERFDYKQTYSFIRNLNTILMIVPGVRIDEMELIENISFEGEPYFRQRVTLKVTSQNEAIRQNLMISEASAKSLATLMKEVVSSYVFPADEHYLSHIVTLLQPIGGRWKAQYSHRNIDVVTGLDDKSDVLGMITKAKSVFSYEKADYFLCLTIGKNKVKKMTFIPEPCATVDKGRSLKREFSLTDSLKTSTNATVAYTLDLTGDNLSVAQVNYSDLNKGDDAGA